MSDSKTAAPNHQQSEPLPWVVQWLGQQRNGARVLDFAAGSGRHSIAALDQGCSVVAADRDGEALARIGSRVETVQTDLEGQPWPFEPASFDAVIVANYLHRDRLDLLGALIRPSGWLIYQTFAVGNEQYGRPSNPDFLLNPGELLALCERCGLRVIGYEHGQVSGPDAVIQRVAAVRPGRSDLAVNARLTS